MLGNEKNTIYKSKFVVSSDEYGRGKSIQKKLFKIKGNKKYIYFPLGGELIRENLI